MIVEVMAPYIGDTMARSAAQAHCRKLGIGRRSRPLTWRRSSPGSGSGLNIFLGRDRSAAVLAETRRALEAAGLAS